MTLIVPTRRKLITGIGILLASPAIVRAQSLTLSGVGTAAGAGGGGSTITWDSGKKAAAVALTNGNLTTSVASNTFYASVLGNGSGRSSGKYYCELTLTTVNLDGQSFGIGNASAALGSILGGNPDNNSIGWLPLAGDVRRGNVSISTIQTAVQGNVLCMSVDIGGTLIWWRTNSGNWNNSGTANPATGVGGISFSTMSAGPYFPGTTLEISGDTFTANFGATAYAQAVPSGFGNW